MVKTDFKAEQPELHRPSSNALEVVKRRLAGSMAVRVRVEHWMPRGRLPPLSFGISTSFTGGGKYEPDDIRFQTL